MEESPLPPEDGFRSRSMSKEVSFRDMATGEISRPGTAEDVKFRPGSRPTPGVAPQVLDTTPEPHDQDEAGFEQKSLDANRRDMQEVSGTALARDVLVLHDDDDEITQDISAEMALPKDHQHIEGLVESQAANTSQASAEEGGEAPPDGFLGFGRVTSAPAPRTVGTPAAVGEGAMVRVLRFVNTLSYLDMAELRELARAGLTIKHKPGETIVEQGEPGDSMFVVIAGTVRLHTDLGELGTEESQSNQTLVLTRGHSFGESALVWGEEGSGLRMHRGREFRAKALTAAVLLELSVDVLLPLLQERCPQTVEELEELHKQTRAATRLQRFARRVKMNQNQQQRLIDMLAKAAREMVAELKNLSPQARAYIAIRQSLSHEIPVRTNSIEAAQPAAQDEEEEQKKGEETGWQQLEEEELEEEEEEEESPQVLKLLVVAVVQCMGLPERAGVGGKAGRAVDARCECRLQDKRYLSDVVVASCDPYWNTAFAYPVRQNADEPTAEGASAEGGKERGSTGGSRRASASPGRWGRRHSPSVEGRKRLEEEQRREVERGEVLEVEVYDEKVQGRWLGPNRRVLLGRARVPAKIGHYWVELGEGEVGAEEMKIEVTVRRFEIAEKTSGRAHKVFKMAEKGGISPSRFQVRGEIQSERAKMRKKEVAQKVVDWMAAEAARPPPPPPSTLIHPASVLRQRLDAAALVASLASLFLAPLSTCFGIRETEGEWLVLLSTLCDLIGMAQVHYRLRSSFLYLDEGSQQWHVELSHARCIDHYLNTPALHAVLAFLHQSLIALRLLSPRHTFKYRKSRLLAWWGGGDPLPAATSPPKGFLWLDLVAAVPAELLLVSTRGGGGGRGWHGLLRGLQMLKTVGVVRIRARMVELEQAWPQRLPALTTLRVLLYLLLSLHWLACLWMLALRASHLLEHWAPTDMTCEDRTVLLDPGTHSAFRYVCAWYWTVQTATGIGYGDIPALTSGERLLAIAVMIGGLGVTVGAVSSIVGWLQDAPSRQAAYSKAVARLTSYLKMRRLPRRLQKRVETLFEQDWEWRRGESDLEVLAPLPLSLRVRALMGMHGTLFRNVAFFSDHLADLRFWRMLLEGMSEACYMEGEYVFREGERAAAMFMVKTGRCEVLSEKRERAVAAKGQDARKLSLGEEDVLERVESDDGPGEAGAGLEQFVLQDLGRDEFDGGLPPSRRGKRILENGELEEEEIEEEEQEGSRREEEDQGGRGGSPDARSRASRLSAKSRKEWDDTAEWEREEDMDLVRGRVEGWYSFGEYAPGEHFGESGVLGGETRLRCASVRTRSYCNMFVVTADCLLKLRRAFPSVRERMDAFVSECRSAGAKQKWRMVWVKHKARILRAAQIIPYPPRPWPYMVLPAEGLSKVFSVAPGAELGWDHVGEGQNMLRMAL